MTGRARILRPLAALLLAGVLRAGEPLVVIVNPAAGVTQLIVEMPADSATRSTEALLVGLRPARN